MKSAKEIMATLGFKDESSEATKVAFVKNLIKQAYGIEIPLDEDHQEPEQLIFHFTEKNNAS